jgi:hypothetical protein
MGADKLVNGHVANETHGPAPKTNRIHTAHLPQEQVPIRRK